MTLDTILQGDALVRLRELPDESVQCIVTSPPYWGLRDYGVADQLGLEKTPEEYVAKMVRIFRECRRVLRKDGTLWLNLGDSYVGNATGTDSDSSGLQGGKSTQRESLKRPNKNGIGLKPKDLVGIPWRVAFALQADGWYLRQDIIWSKPNPMPESVTDRCTKSHEYIFLLTKSAKYYYDNEAIKEPASYNTNARVSRVKMEQHKSAPTAERNGIRAKKWKTPDGWDTTSGNGGHGSFHKEGREKGQRGYKTKSQENGQSPQHHGKDIKGKTVAPGLGIRNNVSFDEATKYQVVDIRNKRSVWSIATQPYKGAHFATFPEEIPETCILAGTKIGDVVLDPFAGSGTTLAVAKSHGRHYLGIELNPEYIKLAEKRLSAISESLFV